MKILKRNDVILIVCLFVLAGILFGIGQLKSAGNQVEIMVNGEAFCEVSLSENRTVEVNGKNTVVVEDGAVSVTQADCPDRLCVGQGKIREAGQSIVCLPNRVVVSIKVKQDSLDGIVR